MGKREWVQLSNQCPDSLAHSLALSYKTWFNVFMYQFAMAAVMKHPNWVT